MFIGIEWEDVRQELVPLFKRVNRNREGECNWVLKFTGRVFQRFMNVGRVYFRDEKLFA